jgi:hypothetical protein
VFENLKHDKHVGVKSMHVIAKIALVSCHVYIFLIKIQIERIYFSPAGIFNFLKNFFVSDQTIALSPKWHAYHKHT